MDWSLPGSSVCGILQARMLEWIAVPSSRGSARPRTQNVISCISCSSWISCTVGASLPPPEEPLMLLVLRCAESLSLVWLFATPWNVARQAPLFLGLPRQEYWSGVPFPTPGDLPYPGIEPVSLCLLHWKADSLPLALPWVHGVGKMMTKSQALLPKFYFCLLSTWNKTELYPPSQSPSFPKAFLMPKT